MAANKLTDLQRKWFLKQTGVGSVANPSWSIDMLEKHFYNTKGIKDISTKNQRIRWFRQDLVTRGGTPVGRYESDILKQLLAKAGLRVSKYYNDNLITYYANT